MWQKPTSVDQRSNARYDQIAARISAARDLFRRQGAIVTTWRTRGAAQARTVLPPRLSRRRSPAIDLHRCLHEARRKSPRTPGRSPSRHTPPPCLPHYPPRTPHRTASPESRVRRPVARRRLHPARLRPPRLPPLGVSTQNAGRCRAGGHQPEFSKGGGQAGQGDGIAALGVGHHPRSAPANDPGALQTNCSRPEPCRL